MLPNLESRVSQVDTRMLILGNLLTGGNPHQAPIPYSHIQPLLCSCLVVSSRFWAETSLVSSHFFLGIRETRSDKSRFHDHHLYLCFAV